MLFEMRQSLQEMLMKPFFHATMQIHGAESNTCMKIILKYNTGIVKADKYH